MIEQLLEMLDPCIAFALDQGCDQLLFRPSDDAVALESEKRLSTEAASIVFFPFTWNDEIDLAVFAHLKKKLPKEWDVRHTDLNGQPRIRAFGPQKHRDFTHGYPNTFFGASDGSLTRPTPSGCSTCSTSQGCNKKTKK